MARPRMAKFCLNPRCTTPPAAAPAANHGMRLLLQRGRPRPVWGGPGVVYSPCKAAGFRFRSNAARIGQVGVDGQSGLMDLACGGLLFWMGW
jgi:hypothetical protein